MDIEMRRLYASLVEQREELVTQLDTLTDSVKPDDYAGTRLQERTLGRLHREVTWRENQVIALLGGIVHYDSM